MCPPAGALAMPTVIDRWLARHGHGGGLNVGVGRVARDSATVCSISARADSAASTFHSHFDMPRNLARVEALYGFGFVSGAPPRQNEGAYRKPLALEFGAGSTIFPAPNAFDGGDVDSIPAARFGDGEARLMWRGVPRRRGGHLGLGS